MITLGNISGSHKYADDGTYTVELCVTDRDGDTTCDQFTVTVNNAAPVVDPIAGSSVGVPASHLDTRRPSAI